MSDETLATTITETAEPAASAEQEAPANDVVANDVATEPVADTPAAAAAEEKKERDSALFNRSLKFREEATAKLQKAEATMAEFRREKETFARDKAEVEKMRTLIDRIKEDPYLIFEAFNIEPADHMRRMMSMSEPVARELAEERRQRKELEAKWEREKEEAKRQSEESAKQNFEFNRQNAKRNFVSFVDRNAEKYAEIAFEEPEELGEIFWETAVQLRGQTSKTPTFDEVADHLQKLVTERRARKEQLRKQRLGAGTSEPGGGTATTQRNAPNGPSANGQGTRNAPATLTNRAATSVGTALREGATDEERDEWARAQLRGLLSKSE